MTTKYLPVLLALFLLGPVQAAQPEQSHNLSEIHPVDEDFNMSDKSIFNLSTLKLNDGTVSGTGLVLDDYSIRDSNSNQIFTLNTGQNEWRVKGADLNLTQGKLVGVGGTDCPDDRAILGDGSCGTTTDDQNLSEVLSRGDTANTSIDMGGNSLRDVGGLYSDSGNKCDSDEYLNGNGVCKQDANTSDDQNLQDVLSRGNSTGSYDVNLNGNSLYTGGSQVEVKNSNGNDVMRWKDGGNVEVPNGNLDMKGNPIDDVTGTTFEDRDGDGDQFQTREDTSGFYEIRGFGGGVTNQDLVKIFHNGNVEIPNGNLNAGGPGRITIDDSTSNDYAGLYLANDGTDEFSFQYRGNNDIAAIRTNDGTTQNVIEFDHSANVNIPNGKFQVSGGAGDIRELAEFHTLGGVTQDALIQVGNQDSRTWNITAVGYGTGTEYNNNYGDYNLVLEPSYDIASDLIVENADVQIPNGNLGIGTSSPLSGVNNNGLQIDHGGHSMLKIGDGANDGGYIQASDGKRRIFIGTNIYDDSSNAWTRPDSSAAAGINVYADEGGWGTEVNIVADQTDSGYPSNVASFKSSGHVDISRGNLDMNGNNIVTASGNWLKLRGGDSTGSNSGVALEDSGGQNLLLARPSGNVGVPSGKLKVGSSSERGSATDLQVEDNDGNGFTQVEFRGSSASQVIQNQNSNLGFYTGDGGSSFTERFQINQGGPVEVKNSDLVLNDGSGSARIKWDTDKSGDALHIQRESSSSETAITAVGTNVGISGQTSPDDALDVGGNLDMNGNAIKDVGQVQDSSGSTMVNFDDSNRDVEINDNTGFQLPVGSDAW